MGEPSGSVNPNNIEVTLLSRGPHFMLLYFPFFVIKIFDRFKLDESSTVIV